MKQKLILAALLFCSTAGWSQQKGRHAAPVDSGLLTSRMQTAPSQVKSLVCMDTLRYTQAKEQIFGTPTFLSGFQVWQEDNEKVSQTYLNSGTLNITGAEIYAANAAGAEPTAEVNISIYSVDASNIPVTLLGGGNITITSTTHAFYYANFPTPVTVTGNYAIVISVTNTSGILDIVTNNETVAAYDELYTRFFSTYATYPNPNNWNTIPVFTPGYNYEPVVAPIVNYSINTQYTPSATSVCLGTPVTYTNATTPAGVFSSRMNNYQVFRTFFGTAPSDSTFVYDMDNGTLVWTGTTTYTHPAAGSYDVLLATNGGFWSSCFDSQSQTITVNAIPAAPTVTPDGPTTFCQGEDVMLSSSAATGNTWSNAAVTQSVTVASSGTYTVTQTLNGCTSPASAPVAVTVNPTTDATFSYPSYTVCTGSSNPVATPANAGGVFSSSPAGLSFVSTSTGEIDMSGSTDGTYTVSYTTTNGTCVLATSHTVTISDAPDADFSYPMATFCANDSDPSPVFGAGASSGTFSSTTGLMIDGSGVIDLSASTAGTYTVTNTIAASGACPMASSSEMVTIVSNTAPSFTQIPNVCQGGTAPSFPSTSANGVTGTWSPAFDNMTTATYTFTPDAGQCANTATMTVTVDAPLAPSFPAVDDYCEGSAIPALPATSLNGVTGTWSPAIDNTQTTTYTFTPTAGQCANTQTQMITIIDQASPTFAAIDNLCIGEAAPALPATSSNGIDGTWSPAAISTAAAGTTTYTFTPGAGECSTNGTIQVTVETCLAIGENVAEDLSVYPNPAGNEVIISFTNATGGNVDVMLISGDGKLVYTSVAESQGQFSETIDLSAVSSGVYYIRLTSGSGVATSKLVKN